LVAEDNKLNQKIANFILLKQNATVSIANNGQEAIDMLKEKPFDVILMDLHMPVLDGLEAVKFIREELKSNIPIIAFTASTFEDESDKCLAAGMDACVSKPFDAITLCNLILKLKNRP
jgi:CheY-like chemotaxis protein